MKKSILTFISLLLFCSIARAAEVKNVVSTQAGSRVLFEFDVAGDSGEEADVNVTLTINGATYTADKLHLEGDYGKVKAGKGRKIYWNALQDFPRGLSTTFDWEIVAGAGPVEGMVLVKGGCYQMGDTFGDGYNNEKPVHEVCVDDFYMGKYEVTQGQWKQIMGNNPSYFKDCGDDCPVEQVSWNDVQDFINKLNQKMDSTGSPQKKYRLPSEAEWEYAAKSGGKKEKFAGSNSESALGEYAWYTNNSGSKTHPVGQKKPNGLGIYDMSGNVWEWVQDWYEEKYYNSSPKNNPRGPSSGSIRALRGGSWNYNPRSVRSAIRIRDYPDGGYGGSGFRLLRTH